ncbi:MAG: helix-turn-helix domain-containing protein [Rhodobacteraceae bacterium]|nr:helix-turn-helix domain-containing protein [Paracoccaceae bacterium]
MSTRKTDSFSVRSLERGLDILRVLNHHNGLTVTETAELVELPRPTSFRLLRTLERLGYIFRDDSDKKFRLTSQVRTLSHGFDEEEWLPNVARPLMIDLCKRILWPVAIITNIGTAMLVRDSTHSMSPFSMFRHRGGFKIPLLHTAAGQMYLACCTPDMREQLINYVVAAEPQTFVRAGVTRPNYTRNLERIAADGHICIKVPGHNQCSLAVPIFTKDGVFAVMSMSFYPSAMSTKQAVDSFAQPMKETAAKISSGLDAWNEKRAA